MGNIVNDKLTNCNWLGIEKDFEEIKNKIDQEEEVADPFLISTIFDSPDLQNKAARVWIKQYPTLDEKKKLETANHKAKIKLGYYSTDFRDHPVGHLITKVLETHDKSKFDIYGFYLSKKQKENDRYYLRIKVTNKPGVLADITKIFGKKSISIESILQKEENEKDANVPIVLVTHKIKEQNLIEALLEIENLDVVKDKIIRIRIEELDS